MCAQWLPVPLLSPRNLYTRNSGTHTVFRIVFRLVCLLFSTRVVPRSFTAARIRTEVPFAAGSTTRFTEYKLCYVCVYFILNVYFSLCRNHVTISTHRKISATNIENTPPPLYGIDPPITVYPGFLFRGRRPISEKFRLFPSFIEIKNKLIKSCVLFPKKKNC